jgi:hypothetical protein
MSWFYFLLGAAVTMVAQHLGDVVLLGAGLGWLLAGGYFCVVD